MVYAGFMCSTDVHVLPVAVVTGLFGGARLLEVDEVEGGVLVERDSGRVVDIVDVVTVFGLPESAAA